MRTHSARTTVLGLAAHAAALFAAAMLLGTLIFWPSVAHADETQPVEGPIIWSVVPAGINGPDGRSWVEKDVDPGAAVKEFLAVRNLSSQDVSFQISAKDGYYTDTGRFNMLESSQENSAAGAWVTVAEDVTVDAGQTAIVPFSIAVPATATPGDQAAGIAVSVLHTGTAENGDQLRVESRMGFKLLLRVTGELAPAAVIDGVEAKYQMSWNPFLPGSIEVAYTVHNTGNTRLKISGAAQASGIVAVGQAEAAAIEMLPGEKRVVNETIAGLWPTAIAPVKVELVGEVPALSGQGTAEPHRITLHAAAQAAAMPWPQLAVLVSVFLIAFAGVHGHRRRRRALTEMVAAARREGELGALR